MIFALKFANECICDLRKENKEMPCTATIMPMSIDLIGSLITLLKKLDLLNDIHIYKIISTLISISKRLFYLHRMLTIAQFFEIFDRMYTLCFCEYHFW